MMFRNGRAAADFFQGFLDFVEKRRSLKLPLFYDPKRARGGTNANPQYQKVGERLGGFAAQVKVKAGRWGDGGGHCRNGKTLRGCCAKRSSTWYATRPRHCSPRRMAGAAARSSCGPDPPAK